MKSLAKARSDARSSRAELTKNFQDIRRRLSPSQLTADALAMVDPELTFLGRVQSGIKRNPLFASVLLAGAGWLFSDTIRARGNSGRNGSHRSRTLKRTGAPPNNHKGDRQ